MPGLPIRRYAVHTASAAPPDRALFHEAGRCRLDGNHRLFHHTTKPLDMTFVA